MTRWTNRLTMDRWTVQVDLLPGQIQKPDHLTVKFSFRALYYFQLGQFGKNDRHD